MTSSFLPPEKSNFGSFGDYSGLGGTPAVNFQGTFDTPSTFNAPNLGVAETFGGNLGGNIFQGSPSVSQAPTEIAVKEPGFLDYIRAIGPAAAGISDIVNAFKGRPTNNLRLAGRQLGQYYNSTDTRGSNESKDSLIKSLRDRVSQLEREIAAPRDVTVTGGADAQPGQADAGEVQRSVRKPEFMIPGISADMPSSTYFGSTAFPMELPDLSGLNIPRI